ncbi:MAG: hypothetical protein Q9170_005541 [Blastenia crenularia]
MKFAVIAALQLFETCSHFTDSATLPPNYLAGQDQGRETKETFDQVTVNFKQQGQCRVYRESADKKKSELDTCEPKCGNLVKKAMEMENPMSLGCRERSDSIGEHVDPDGDKYDHGLCVCEIPVASQVVAGAPLNLPVVADLGCPILYAAFDTILNDGEKAIPITEPSMDVGMEAAIRAAKTIADSGKRANAFLDWFQYPCGDDKYVNANDKIFVALLQVPDSPITSSSSKAANDKERRSPKKGKGGKGKGGKGKAGKGKGKGGKGGTSAKSGSGGKDSKPTVGANKPNPTTPKVNEVPTQGTKPEHSSTAKAQQSISISRETTSTTALPPSSGKLSKVKSRAPQPTASPTRNQLSRGNNLSSETTLGVQDIPSNTAIKSIQNGASSSGGQLLATRSAEKGDSSLALMTRPPPTATDVDQSSGIDGAPPKTTRAVSTVSPMTSPVSSGRVITCSAKPTTAQTTTLSTKSLDKRRDPPIRGDGYGLHMSTRAGLGGTYVGWVDIRADVDCFELAQFASAGYNQISSLPGINNGAIIVAALWIQDIGVVVGSKPRPGPGHFTTQTQRGDAVAAELWRLVHEWFPAYLHANNGREHFDPTKQTRLDLWHAEDVALVFGARLRHTLLAGRDYPRPPAPLIDFGYRAEILAYGKYHGRDTLGYKPPCGFANTDEAMMQPSCAAVLADLRVTYIKYRDTVPGG